MFIGRLPDGTVYGAWANAQANDKDHIGLEEVASDHPDYVAFMALASVVKPDPRAAKIAELESRIVAVETVVDAKAVGTAVL